MSVILLPFARQVFDTTPHPPWEWGLIFLLSLAPVTIIGVSKLARAAIAARARSADPAGGAES